MQSSIPWAWFPQPMHAGLLLVVPWDPPKPPCKGYKQPQPWTEGVRCWLTHPPALGVLGAPEVGTGQGFHYTQRPPGREKGFSAE